MVADLLVRDRRARDRADAALVASEMGAEQLRSWLRGTSARRIFARYSRGAAGMIDNPTLFRDGTVLPADGYRAFETGAYASRVPLVIGSNADEVKLFQFLDASMDWQGQRYAAAARFGSDRWKADGVDAVARRLAADSGQPPVYAYHFRWGACTKTARACCRTHGADVLARSTR
jgi:para-nitrobenzyl esterase